MARVKLKRGCPCKYCEGCYRLKEKGFKGINECKVYRPCDKKVWCADEVVNKYNNTGYVK